MDIIFYIRSAHKVPGNAGKEMCIRDRLTGLCWPEAGRIFMKAVEWVLSLYDFLCQKAETLFRNLVLGRPESWKIFLYVGFLAGFWLVLYKWQKRKDRKGEGEEKGRERERKKWLLSISAFFSLLSLFLICLLFFAPVPDGSLKISVLDVGQGDSIYIKGGKGTTVLLDGGSSSEREVGSNRLAPFLKSQGVDCLNYVILTHLDQDHVSGVRELLEEGFPIEIGRAHV